MADIHPHPRSCGSLIIERTLDDDLDRNVLIGGLATLHGLMEAFSCGEDGRPDPDLIRVIDWTGVADFVKALHTQFYNLSVFARLTTALDRVEGQERESARLRDEA